MIWKKKHMCGLYIYIYIYIKRKKGKRERENSERKFRAKIQRDPSHL